MKKSAEKILVGLIGAGGFGREVMPIVQENVDVMRAAAMDQEIEIVFVETQPVEQSLNGYPILSAAEFFSRDAGVKLFNIAVANSRGREVIAKQFMENGCQPMTVQAPSTRFYDSNSIDEGAVFCDNCMVTSNATIGKFFHCNMFSYVAHDCEIGDFVTFGARVSCNGNVKIGDHAYIGTGASIKQGRLGAPRLIGEGAVIGMGAVVVEDVPPYTTVVGNPARVLQK